MNGSRLSNTEQQHNNFLWHTMDAQIEIPRTPKIEKFDVIIVLV